MYKPEQPVRLKGEVREMLDPGILDVLEKTSLVYASGIPSIRLGEKDTYYGQNMYEEDIVLQIFSAGIADISRSAGRHIPEMFLGRYAILNGCDYENEIEYVFPVRNETQFSLRPH